MFQSYFVHFSILLSVLFAAVKIAKHRTYIMSDGMCCRIYNYPYWKFAIIPIVVYTFFNGFRYDVGTDSTHYLYLFEEIQGGIDYDLLEPGFYWLNKLLIGLHFESYSILILTSFIYICSFFILLKQYRCILIYALPLYLNSMFQAENLVRQFLAINILMIGIYYYFQDKKKYYWILGTIAFSIHSTALLGIVVYWAITKIKHININVIIGLYILTLVLGISMLKYMEIPLQYLSFLGDYGVKSNYFESIRSLVDNSRVGLYGEMTVLGTIFTCCKSLFLIFYGYFLIKRYKFGFYHFVYYISVLSFLLLNLFQSHELFGRLVLYFSIFDAVLVGFVAYDVFSNKALNNFLKCVSVVAVTIILMQSIYAFISGVSVMADEMGHPFTFYWEREHVIPKSL